jgi:chromosome segregation ATPase
LRRLAFLLLLTVVAPAQEGTQPQTLAQTAARASAAWEGLAKSLEVRIARMLPCDPRVSAAIEEVSQASDARLAALNQYIQAVAAQARQDSDAARAAIAAEQALARDVETDRAEAAQEKIAVDGQLSDLSDSAKRRPALEEARARLEGISATIAARAANLQSQATRRAALLASLTDLAAAREARQRALEMRLAALAIETSRWGDYYAARLARARTECDITNPTRPVRKKQ